MLKYSDTHRDPGKAAEYDNLFSKDVRTHCIWRREQEVLRQILAEFYQGRKIELLDFACGTGRITTFLEPLVESATGVDVSEAMIAQARPKLKRTRLLIGNIVEGDDYLLEQESFNLITAFRFFLNAEPSLRLAVIKKLRQLLTPEGYLVFNNHQNRNSLLWLKIRCYSGVTGSLLPSNFMPFRDCIALVRAAGLRIVRVYPVELLNIPKMHFSSLAQRFGDGIANKCNLLGRFSASPIIVCQKR